MNALVLRWHDECVTFLESVELPEHFLDKDDVICVSFNKTYETSGKLCKIAFSNIYVIQNLKGFVNFRSKKKNVKSYEKNSCFYFNKARMKHL